MILTTTLNKIRACRPGTDGWKTLLNHLGSDFDADAEINLLTILESNGISGMLWTLRATNQDARRIAAVLAIVVAEQALPTFEAVYPDDTRPRAAIQAANDYLDGVISLECLKQCRADASDAARVSSSIDYASCTAAFMAAESAEVAGFAFEVAGYVAGYVAEAAGRAAAYAEKQTRQKQAEIIRRFLEY